MLGVYAVAHLAPSVIEVVCTKLLSRPRVSLGKGRIPQSPNPDVRGLGADCRAGMIGV